jgi:hypothetical protein
VLSGARSFAAVAEYAHDAGRVVLAALGAGSVVPHESTLRRILQKIDNSVLEAALRSWVLAQLDALPPPAGTPRREQRRVLALDGKTLRGARVRAADGGVYLPHLVSVLDQASGVVLGQVQVDHKTSEVAAFGTLLDDLDLSDVLVTADALRTHRGHADYLHQRGGHYLMTIKANQPRLLARVRTLPWADIGIATRERRAGVLPEPRRAALGSAGRGARLATERRPRACGPPFPRCPRRAPLRRSTRWTEPSTPDRNLGARIREEPQRHLADAVQYAEMTTPSVA